MPSHSPQLVSVIVTRVGACFLLLGCCFLITGLHAEAVQVLVKYEVFRLPQKAAEALQATKPSDIDLYTAIQRSVKAGSATADKIILLHALVGNTAKLQQIDEWAFPDPSYLPEDARFVVQNLGEELEVTPEPPEEGEGLILEVESSSTQLRLAKDGKSTFLKAPLSVRLATMPDRPSLLGTLKSHPAEVSGTVALAFLTPKVHHFPEDEDGKNVSAPARFRAQFEVISVPQATAVLLVDGTPDHTELYGKLHNLISAKTAKLETLQLMQAKLGQRCKVEHIDEFPFPGDFDKGQTPEQVTITDPVLRALLMNPNPAPTTLPPPNGGSSLISPPAPTTFSERNLGDTLELGVRGHRDGSVTVDLSAQKVRLLSMQRYESKDQPCFTKQALHTEVRMGINSSMLLGTMNRPLKTGAPGSEPEDRVWLAFLTLRN
jgi:hypothetical protein